MSSAVYWKLFNIIYKMLETDVTNWPRNYIHAIRFGWEGSDYQEMILSIRTVQARANAIDMTNLVYISAYEGKDKYKHPVKTALSRAFRDVKSAETAEMTSHNTDVLIDRLYANDVIRLELNVPHATIMWMLYNDYRSTDICNHFGIDRGYLRKLKNELLTILQKDICAKEKEER